MPVRQAGVGHGSPVVVSIGFPLQAGAPRSLPIQGGAINRAGLATTFDRCQHWGSVAGYLNAPRETHQGMCT